MLFRSSVSYSNLIAGLYVETIKELDDKITKLESIVNAQQKVIDILLTNYKNSIDDGK